MYRDASPYQAEAAWARAELAKLDAKIQAVCWDGEWFIWAIGQDGTVYGTKNVAECQVYMNTQGRLSEPSAAASFPRRTAPRGAPFLPPHFHADPRRSRVRQERRCHGGAAAWFRPGQPACSRMGRG